MTEYSTEIIEEAKKATNCMEWLHRCQSECCRTFTVTRTEGWNDIKEGSIISFKLSPEANTPGRRWYYQLHGASVEHGIVRVKLQNFKVHGNTLIISRRCDFLTDEGKCKGYLTGRPSICKEYDTNTALTGKYHDPKMCLYKIKKEMKL